MFFIDKNTIILNQYIIKNHLNLLEYGLTFTIS